MANFQADNAAAVAAIPQQRVKSNKQHGRIRYFEATYTAPATGMPAVADTIEWGSLPVGVRVIGHLSQLRWGAGTAASTLNLGDAGSADRHLAATAITSAGSAVPEAAAAAGVASFETTDATNKLISTIAGAGLAASQALTLRIAYAAD